MIIACKELLRRRAREWGQAHEISLRTGRASSLPLPELLPALFRAEIFKLPVDLKAYRRAYRDVAVADRVEDHLLARALGPGVAVMARCGLLRGLYRPFPQERDEEEYGEEYD